MLQRGLADDFVPVHRAGHGAGDVLERDAALAEGFDGDFVGGVEHGGQRAPDVTGTAGEVQGGETLRVGFLEGEACKRRCLASSGLQAR